LIERQIEITGPFFSSNRRGDSHNDAHVTAGPHAMRFTDLGDQYIPGFCGNLGPIRPKEKAITLDDLDGKLPVQVM
jgi:hypothetical protein